MRNPRTASPIEIRHALPGRVRFGVRRPRGGGRSAAPARQPQAHGSLRSVDRRRRQGRAPGARGLHDPDAGGGRQARGSHRRRQPGAFETAEVVKQLRHSGVRQTVLLTGDEKPAAEALAARLGIETTFASTLPEDKVAIVARLKEAGGVVTMVGDGVNDALALAEADVGVAMGAGGSEVAIESADIALATDDLRGLSYVHALGQAALRVAYQNFWIATGSNLAGATLGELGRLSPVGAGLIHVVHTLGVLANSSRLLRFEPAKDGNPFR